MLFPYKVDSVGNLLHPMIFFLLAQMLPQKAPICNDFLAFSMMYWSYLTHTNSQEYLEVISLLPAQREV